MPLLRVFAVVFLVRSYISITVYFEGDKITSRNHHIIGGFQAEDNRKYSITQT